MRRLFIRGGGRFGRLLQRYEWYANENGVCYCLGWLGMVGEKVLTGKREHVREATFEH